MLPHFPPEVLTEILSYTKNDGIDITNPNTYPTNLSLVCKSWHALTLSAPEIWSHIRIDLDDGADTGSPSSGDINIEYGAIDNSLSPRILLALRTCLDRSGLLKPLTLCIRARELSGIGSQRKRDLLGSALNSLLCHAHRWSEVSFDFDIDLFAFMFPPNRSYPHLRKLELLHGVQDPILPTNSLPVGTFSNAPILEELHLYQFPRFLPHLSIPWSCITHFSVSAAVDIFAYTLLQVIALMPNLRTLTLDHTCPLSIDPGHFLLPPEYPLGLLALERLEIRSRISLTHLHTFFKWIYTPRIKSLELRLFSRRHSPGGVQEIGNLISRSHCKITCLTLRRVHEVDVLVLLKQVSSSIEVLELEDIHFSKKLLNRMTIPRSMHALSTSSNVKKKSCLGEQIKRMVINRPEFIDPEKGPTMFISMIRSRLPALRPNRPLTLHPDSAPPPDNTPERQGFPSLTRLRIVIPAFDHEPSDSGSPTGQLTVGLYRRLVKNFAEVGYEPLGIKLEFLEEVLLKHPRYPTVGMVS